METRQPLWTIAGLSEAVASALESGYGGAPNGRVRAVPDRRTIRYYTTLGLIDRPLEMRGRTAYYGRRHLLQLVAIKKLQAAGHGLVEVQRALAGQTDAGLARIAGLDVSTSAFASGEKSAAGGAPAPATLPAPACADAGAAGPSGPEGAANCVPPRRAGDFWRQRPAPRSAERSGRGGPSEELEAAGRLLRGVELVEGVTLLLTSSRPIDAQDIEALRDAAGPLIETLLRRQLLVPSDPDPREEGGPP